MNAVARPRTRPDRRRRWAAVLAAAVRAEFDVDSYVPGPDDPALGRLSCRVPGCAGYAHARRICHVHHQLWTAQARPDLDVFVAGASPLDRQTRRSRNAFDLYALTGTARLEVGYVLQCRHDERGAPLTPRVVAALTALLRRAGVSSLLDRPLTPANPR